MQVLEKELTQVDIKKIRSDFPLLENTMRGKPLVFLDSAASSQKPQVVIDAISEYYEKQHANVHRGVYELSQNATDAFELGRERVRKFLNASSSDEIIFTRGTSESINLVASSYGRKFLNEGDEVVISTMEHHSNIVPWQMICEERKAVLRVIPINDKGEILLEKYRALLSEKTKIVSIVHVSNSLGTINPVKQMIDIAHDHNIPVLIDGAQATLHGKVDVQDLDADFYAFSAHKVYGPTGIGVLYGKREWLERIPPYQGGGEMIETVRFDKTTYNKIPFKFEAGTPNIAGAVGLGVALEYVQSIGYDAISSHEQHLLEYATEGLMQIEGLKIYGTADKKASVISFNVDGIHPYDIGTILDKLGIAVRTGHHCTQPLMEQWNIPGTVRASFAVYNNKEDVDQLIQGVKRAVLMLS
ncbi:MAG: cysteine desulfurase [Saprospiraceae bacterium]|nr:cysteine desulfurase [Saprospiraceae bacterium]